MEDFSQRKCKPCEGGMPPLTPQEAAKYSSAVSGWQMEEDKKIKKEFKFADFKGAMEFVNRIARLAEEESHHPAIFISYNKVRLTFSTHAIGGLSENDFIMAAKTDKLATGG